MFVGQGQGLLSPCPHMAARCPHKEDRCDDPQSKQCHYVRAATTSARLAIASLRALGVYNLSGDEQEHLRDLEAFLEQSNLPPERYRP